MNRVRNISLRMENMIGAPIVGRKIQDNDRTMSWADVVKTGKQ